MNFLKVPDSRLNPNANMDEEQLQVAATFVDELIDLRVVGTLAEGQAILLSCPALYSPKGGPRRTMASDSRHAAGKAKYVYW
jgi:hypothetical protein